jgi:hypothetical protein
MQMNLADFMAFPNRPAKSLRNLANLHHTSLLKLLALVFLFASPAMTEAQFAYVVTNATITIVGYSGPGGPLTITNEVNGLPVVNIGDYAFEDCASLTTVTIPNTVTSIGYRAFFRCAGLTRVSIPNSVTNVGDYAFLGCTSLTNATIGNSVPIIGDHTFFSCLSLTSFTIGNSVTSIGNDAFSTCLSLTSVIVPNSVTNMADYAFASCGNSLTGIYFQANAPTAVSNVFSGDNYLTVYYLPGTTGWGPFFAERPAVLWNPPAQISVANVGVRTNQFGFNITETSNLVLVVEASTNLANPVWSPLGTYTQTGGPCYFSDPEWTNYQARFYRLRWP